MNLNFYPWESDVSRDQIPFWVQLEIPDNLLGGKLCSAGWIFRETTAGQFQDSVDGVLRCRVIEGND
jgi:hypothetical protein